MDIFLKEGRLVQGYKAIKTDFHKFLDRNILGKPIRIEFLFEDQNHLSGFIDITVKHIQQPADYFCRKFFIINDSIGLYFDDYEKEAEYLYLKIKDKNTVCVIKEDGEPWK